MPKERRGQVICLLLGEREEQGSFQAGLHECIAWGLGHNNSHMPHALNLLRTPTERPYNRTAKKRDELPPSHSIISSARASNIGGMVRPSALAVLRLITNSIFVA